MNRVCVCTLYNPSGGRDNTDGQEHWVSLGNTVCLQLAFIHKGIYLNRRLSLEQLPPPLFFFRS